jgi:hypothetical protein
MPVPPWAGRGRTSLPSCTASSWPFGATCAVRERGVRFVQKMQVGPCVPAGIQPQKATSGPTRHLSHSCSFLAPSSCRDEIACTSGPLPTYGAGRVVYHACTTLPIGACMYACIGACTGTAMHTYMYQCCLPRELSRQGSVHSGWSPLAAQRLVTNGPRRGGVIPCRCATTVRRGTMAGTARCDARHGGILTPLASKQTRAPACLRHVSRVSDSPHNISCPISWGAMGRGILCRDSMGLGTHAAGMPESHAPACLTRECVAPQR